MVYGDFIRSVFPYSLLTTSKLKTSSYRKARYEQMGESGIGTGSLRLKCTSLSASCELRRKFRLGGTYRGLYRVWGGPIKGYTTNLVQDSCPFVCANVCIKDKLFSPSRHAIT